MRRHDPSLARLIPALGAVMAALASMLGPVPASAGFWQDMKQAANAGLNPTLRGRVELQDGRTLTCFEGVKTGYIGPPDLAAPGYTVKDPATGVLSVRTAAIPAIIMLKPATVMSNDCDTLAAQGLLSQADQTATGGTGTSAARLNDRTPCREVPVNQRAQYPRCISFDPEDHCSALPVYGGWLPGQTDLSAICNSRKTNALMEQEAAYQRKLAAAKAGGAIGASTATASVRAIDPAPAPAATVTPALLLSQSAEAASLCRLRPALAAGLREEALQFVRIDRARDRIVMSEMTAGSRREVAMDDTTFARRAADGANAISAGGVRCGMAYWDAQAIKAATAAMTRKP